MVHQSRAVLHSDTGFRDEWVSLENRASRLVGEKQPRLVATSCQAGHWMRSYLVSGNAIRGFLILTSVETEYKISISFSHRHGVHIVIVERTLKETHSPSLVD